MGFFQGPEKKYVFVFFIGAEGTRTNSAPNLRLPGPKLCFTHHSWSPIFGITVFCFRDPLFLFFTVHGFWKRVPSSFTHGFFCFLFSIARCSVSFFAVKKNAFKLPCVHWRSSMQCCRNSLRPHALEAVATLYHQAFKDEEFEKLSSVYSLKKWSLRSTVMAVRVPFKAVKEVEAMGDVVVSYPHHVCFGFWVWGCVGRMLSAGRMPGTRPFFYFQLALCFCMIEFS